MDIDIDVKAGWRCGCITCRGNNFNRNLNGERKGDSKMRIAGLIITVLLGIGMSCIGISSGMSTGSSSSRGGGQNQNTTIIIQKDAAGSPAEENKKSLAEAKNAVGNFASRNYSKINADNKNGGGAYLSSLVTLLGDAGIPEADAHALVELALKQSGGNSEIFLEEIERFMD